MIKVTTEVDGAVVSSLNLYILENDDPAHDNRPFALIENIRTDPEHRRKGHASRNIRRAEQMARDAGCYKMMICTSSSREEVHRLYRNAGYDGGYKTCYYKAL